MITVFADQYLHNLESCLPGEVDLHLFEPGNGLPDAAQRADALLIRTVTKINEKTLAGKSMHLEFIGSASAGTDHIDIGLLEGSGITFAHAPGCNARAVSEYVATAILMWGDEHNIHLKDKHVGVIGAGHVGSEVIQLLNALDFSMVAYDPPRDARDPDFNSAALEEALECDILTFHTPLTYEGAYPTYHWLGQEKLDKYTFDLIINTSRGGVIEEEALINKLENGKVGDVIIDVWENEPAFNSRLAKRAFKRTPHIAGYSRQAKENATLQISRALCDYFSLPFPADAESPGEEHNDTLIHTLNSSSNSLGDILSHIHPINEYESGLLSILDLTPDEKESTFNHLRTELPLRNEYRFIKVPEPLINAYPSLEILGCSPIK